MTDTFGIRQERLLAGANVLPSHGAAAGSSPLGHSTITFAEDETYGTYISELTSGNVRFTFNPTYLFKFGLFNDTTNEVIELTTVAWAPTVAEAETTGEVAISMTLPSPYADISIAITLSPLAEGYRVSSLIVDNDSATYALEWAEFPRLACKPPSGVASNGWLAHGFCAGLVIPNPYEKDLTNFTIALECPPSMQFFDYFDISTKDHLYIASDDDDGWRKMHQLLGDGSSVSTQGFRHFFPNPKRAGNGAGVMPFTLPYNINIEMFKGKTADGRCGGYDSALRYRAWATHTDRPWIAAAGGPWAASAAVSSRVKNSDFYYVRLTNQGLAGTPHTTIVEDMRRLKEFIQLFTGAIEMMGLLYGWSENMDFINDFQPPAFFPLIEAADLETALQLAEINDIYLSWYTIPQWWDNGLTGAPSVPFRYDDFIGTIDYNAISQYVIRDYDNVPLTGFVNEDLLPPIIDP